MDMLITAAMTHISAAHMGKAVMVTGRSLTDPRMLTRTVTRTAPTMRTVTTPPNLTEIPCSP
jgi:hypothetical protein